VTVGCPSVPGWVRGNAKNSRNVGQYCLSERGLFTAGRRVWLCLTTSLGATGIQLVLLGGMGFYTFWGGKMLVGEEPTQVAPALLQAHLKHSVVDLLGGHRNHGELQ
jgi:hypothetical protein